MKKPALHIAALALSASLVATPAEAVRTFTFNFTPSGATYLVTPSPFPNPSGLPVYGYALGGALNVTLNDANNGVIHADAPGYFYDCCQSFNPYTFSPLVDVDPDGQLISARLFLDSERYIAYFSQYHDLVHVDYGGVVTVLAPVPEPETWMLALVGVGALITRLLRVKKIGRRTSSVAT